MRMPNGHKLTEQHMKIASMRTLSDEQKAEEERYDVSTELTLYTDPWTIKKTLTASDLGGNSRLILHTNLAVGKIIRYLNEDDQRMIQEGLSIMVNVFDHDTQETFPLRFKRYACSGSYVLNGEWRSSFVRRRKLRVGDQIGLFWDRFDRKFHFRVLSRAAPQLSASQRNPN